MYLLKEWHAFYELLERSILTFTSKVIALIDALSIQFVTNIYKF